jgi:hypothetical protein
MTRIRGIEKLVLSLGDVGDVAEVSVHGKPLGFRWTPPYSFDITSVAHPVEVRCESSRFVPGPRNLFG